MDLWWLHPEGRARRGPLVGSPILSSKLRGPPGRTGLGVTGRASRFTGTLQPRQNPAVHESALPPDGGPRSRAATPDGGRRWGPYDRGLLGQRRVPAGLLPPGRGSGVPVVDAGRLASGPADRCTTRPSGSPR